MQPYVDHLSRHGELVHHFPITPLDRTGVPVVSASVWGAEESAHGVGYGETEAEAARSAYGECVENLAALRYARRVEPVELDLEAARARGAVDVASLSLVAGSAVPDTLLWVPARTLDGRERLVPLEAAVTCAGEWAIAAGDREPLVPPITNGQGAAYGGDRARAVRHGLLELLQRDVNWHQFKALDTGRWVEEAPVDVGLDVRLAYAGQAFGAHVFHASAVEPAGSALASVARTSTGEGADPDPRVAARKAVLELCSSRCRKQFFFGGPEALAVAPEEYRERFGSVAAEPLVENGWTLDERFDALLGDPEALERVVARITRRSERVAALPTAYAADAPLRALGDEVLVIEMTEPGEAACVVKVVVPGLEAEVLSHHRVGPRGYERLRLRLPHVVHDGSDAPGGGGAGWARAASGWVDRDALRALAEDFLPLYREPDRHAYAAPDAREAVA